MICKILLMNINTHSIKSMDPKFSQSDRKSWEKKRPIHLMQNYSHGILVMVQNCLHVSVLAKYVVT